MRVEQPWGCDTETDYEFFDEIQWGVANYDFDLQRYLELDKPQDQRRYGSEYQCTVDDINRVVLAVGEYLATRA